MWILFWVTAIAPCWGTRLAITPVQIGSAQRATTEQETCASLQTGLLLTSPDNWDEQKHCWQLTVWICDVLRFRIQRFATCTKQTMETVLYPNRKVGSCAVFIFLSVSVHGMKPELFASKSTAVKARFAEQRNTRAFLLVLSCSLNLCGYFEK